MRGATSRAVMSVGPPAENGTIMRSGFAGKDCADAGAAGNRQQKTAAARSSWLMTDPPGKE
jgi:hypothetical protein